jgi:PAS domain S-box-containing protein
MVHCCTCSTPFLEGKENEMFHDDPGMDVITENLEHWSLRDTRQDALALLDADGVICYLNPAWETLSGAGYAAGFRTGEHYLAAVTNVFHPGDRFMQTMHRGLRAVLSGDRDYVELEYPCQRSGAVRWFLVRMSAHAVGGQRGVLLQQHHLHEQVMR